MLITQDFDEEAQELTLQEVLFKRMCSESERHEIVGRFELLTIDGVRQPFVVSPIQQMVVVDFILPEDVELTDVFLGVTVYYEKRRDDLQKRVTQQLESLEIEDFATCLCR